MIQILKARNEWYDPRFYTWLVPEPSRVNINSSGNRRVLIWIELDLALLTIVIPRQRLKNHAPHEDGLLGCFGAYLTFGWPSLRISLLFYQSLPGVSCWYFSLRYSPTRILISLAQDEQHQSSLSLVSWWSQNLMRWYLSLLMHLHHASS